VIITTEPEQVLPGDKAEALRRVPWRRPASTWWGTSSIACPQLGARAAYVRQAVRDKLIEHKQYVVRHGEDMPEIQAWR
jgi:XFP C-terminal domain